MSASKEEGEIEEGELPEEYTSPVDDAPPLSERSPNGYQAANNNDTGPATTTSGYEPGYSSRPSGYAPHKHSSTSGRYHDRDWHRSSSHHSSNSDWGRGDSYRESSSSGLLHEVDYLTRNTGITDAIRNLDDVCKRLDSAMSILSSIWKSSERGASLPAGFPPKAAALHKALRGVHVASGTGAGKTQNMERAKAAMKGAWQLRERLFTPAQQKELESWITNSKFFKFILAPEPEPQPEPQPELLKPKTEAAAAEAPADRPGGGAAAAEGAGPDEREQGEIEAPPAPPPDQRSNGSASTATAAAPAGAADGGRAKRQWDDAAGAGDAPQPQHKQQRRAAGSREPTPPASPAVPVVALNEEELARVLQTDARDLLRQGKLCLVLDLDHTLLNSAKFSELTPATELSLQNRLAHEAQAVPQGQRELHRLPMVGMWTKLRPGVREFLQRAADKFELWIHTNGNRQYATAVVEVLDPEQRYFGSRVITGMGADQGVAAQMTKRLMQGLEGREPVVIIVDDSSAVWPHDLRNLLVVERYLYFPSASHRPGASLLELNRDECPKSGMLKTAIRVIETVHAEVFQRLSSSNPTPPASPSAAPPSYPRWDVREVLTSEKQKILAGCNVVFTRVIPLGTDPKHNNYWQLAESYGATCSERLTEETTHVIAAVAGTEKANQARAMRKHVVNLSWLNASCILWQRADESLFELRE